MYENATKQKKTISKIHRAYCCIKIFGGEWEPNTNTREQFL